MSTEAIITKLGVALITRAVPSGIALVKSWIKGKTILIVGQGRAGKTTFSDYLQYGLFEDEKDTFKTLSVKSSSRFDIKMGRDQTLEMVVKKTLDIPGQIGPAAHADLVVENRPHAVIVMLDLTTPLEGESDRACGEWLSEFCKHLENSWRVSKRSKNRIATMIVVLNKQDKVDSSTVANHTQAMRRILKDELREARGRMTNDIPVKPCTLVTNPADKRLVDSIIAELAKSLAS